MDIKNLFKGGGRFVYNGKDGRIGSCLTPDSDNPLYRVYIDGSSNQYMRHSELCEIFGRDSVLTPPKSPD